MSRYELSPGSTLQGRIRVPGDKSISHRAVMLASIAEGVTDITGFLSGEDCLCTMKAFLQMGVRIERLAETELRVHGVGLQGLTAPAAALDMGNSGTAMRLMCGLLAGQAFDTLLTGDASLSKRPMKRVIEPLAAMGANIHSDQGKAPLQIKSTAGALKGRHYDSPVASAQVKSCVLLAGLYAEGRTEVREPEPSRDHTERMLQAFSVEIDARPGYAALAGGQILKAAPITVPADISSAAFFMVGAAITPGSDITLVDVGINPTRVGIITILKAMGADIQLLNHRHLGAEPVADVRVLGGPLKGIAIGSELVASAIDEFPILFIAAACAEGETLVTGAEELRVKESDRIATMADGLIALGVDAEARPDGARIQGLGASGELLGGTIDSHGDHRIAMSFAMASLRSRGLICIEDCMNVNTSFPGFAELGRNAGLNLRVIN